MQSVMVISFIRKVTFISSFKLYDTLECWNHVRWRNHL